MVGGRIKRKRGEEENQFQKEERKRKRREKKTKEYKGISYEGSDIQKGVFTSRRMFIKEVREKRAKKE